MSKKDIAYKQTSLYRCKKSRQFFFVKTSIHLVTNAEAIEWLMNTSPKRKHD